MSHCILAGIIVLSLLTIIAAIKQLELDRESNAYAIVDDMKLRRDEWQMLQADIKVFGRNGAIYRHLHWPDAIVRYHYSINLNIKTRHILDKAMEHISSRSCIRFLEVNDINEGTLKILWGRRCYASIGYQNNMENQVLMVSPGCNTLGTVAHELMHVLGFYHMHSAPDRDLFVEIKPANILNGMHNQFNKMSPDMLYNYGVPYDFGSIMHYPAWAFSKNGLATIVPREHGIEIGQREALSDGDFLKLNRMYECVQESSELI